MNKKGIVAVGALLIVALLATMAFVPAMFSSEDASEDTQNSAL